MADTDLKHELSMLRVKALLEHAVKLLYGKTAEEGHFYAEELSGKIQAALESIELEAHALVVGSLGARHKWHHLWLYEVLGDAEIPGDTSMRELAEACRTGDNVGDAVLISVQQLPDKLMETALYDLGSEPGFLFPQWEEPEGEEE